MSINKNTSETSNKGRRKKGNKLLRRKMNMLRIQIAFQQEHYYNNIYTSQFMYVLQELQSDYKICQATHSAECVVPMFVVGYMTIYL